MKTLNEDMDPLFQRHGDRSHRDEFLPPLGTVSSRESMKKDTQTQVNENPRASMKTGWFEIVLLSFAGNSSKIIDHQFDGNWWMAPTSSSEVVANKVTLAPCIDDFGSSLCWRGHGFFLRCLQPPLISTTCGWTKNWRVFEMTLTKAKLRIRISDYHIHIDSLSGNRVALPTRGTRSNTLDIDWYLNMNLWLIYVNIG